MVRRDGDRVRCFTKNGHDRTNRFPAIVEAARCLTPQSFLIDGEAVNFADDGSYDFNALRSRGHQAVLMAFDLLQQSGKDLRDLPLIERKRWLTRLIGKGKRIATGIQYVDHIRAKARQCLPTSAAWGWRASCRSGWMRPIASQVLIPGTLT
jgi:ATP-dependent DNA ligase